MNINQKMSHYIGQNIEIGNKKINFIWYPGLYLNGLRKKGKLFHVPIEMKFVF